MLHNFSLLDMANVTYVQAGALSCSSVTHVDRSIGLRHAPSQETVTSIRLEEQNSDPGPHSEPDTVMCTTMILEGLAQHLGSLIPRRNLEPTGWLDCALDILLGLFLQKGASEEKIKQLAVRQWEETVGYDCEGCAICLTQFVSGDEVTELACSHAFCRECIGMWLAKRNMCPMCKAEGC